MRVKKCLSMLLAVIMIGTMITSLPITASAVDIHTAAIGEGTVITVKTAEELNTACDSINENGGIYTIDLTDSFEGQVNITNEAAVVTVISSKGKTLTNPTTAVYVENGATVKLGGNGNTKLTLQGNDQPHNTGEGNDDPGLIYILPGSTCEMNENVTLKDRKGNNYLGGGVTVNGGNFIMNGGTIEKCGIDARVVSMLSMEVFEKQPKKYKESVLPNSVRARVSVEAGSTMPWFKYVGLDGKAIGIDRFGVSAPAKQLFEKFGFTVENVVNTAKEVLGK